MWIHVPFSLCAGDMLQSVFGHRHVVNCVDFSPEEGFHAHAGAGLIGTGSHDATVLLWRWSGKLHRVVGALAPSQGSADSYATGRQFNPSAVLPLFPPLSIFSFFPLDHVVVAIQ